MKRNLFFLITLCLGLPAFAHTRAADSIPANPADVSSPDAIIAALYNVISGPADQKRNWDRMRTLFKPEASMIPSGRKNDNTPYCRYISVEDYIKLVGPNLEKGGFFEKEIGRATQAYGNLMQVFSAYEARRKENDEKPFLRGINGIQLWNDGQRWWIMNIFWQPETPDNPLPKL